MKPQLKKFAPIGLYLAGIAALVSAGIYIVQKSFTLPLQISLAVIVFGIATFALLDPNRIREGLTGRQAKYGSNAFVMAIAFLGIVIVINYIVVKNDRRWDLTEDKQHTLAPETIQALQKLPGLVTAEAFYTQRYSSTTAKTLLDNYKFSSTGKFDYKFIDPEADPLAAQSAKVTRDGTIVLSMDNRHEPVTYESEQEITAALIRLANPGSRALYFLTGHGEIDPKVSGDISYSQVKNTLETKNYTINSLNLISSPSIPEDALAIIIAGAKKPLTSPEISIIQDYLDNRKGSLVVLSDPRPLTNFGDAIDPMADFLSISWGITLGEDMIVDPNVNPAWVAIADSYGTHPITEKLQGTASFFPTARSVSSNKNAPTTITQTVLVLTASNAWGEIDYESLKSSVSLDKTKDFVGPVPVAVSASSTLTNARVVVIGDSDFASDQYFSQLASGDFFINGIDWAAKQENLINLTPKNQTSRFIVAPTITTMGLVQLVSIFVMPGVFIAFGIGSWIQRRRRG